MRALDPDAGRVLEMMRLAGRPPLETLTPAAARVMFAAAQRVLQPDAEAVAAVRDLVAPRSSGGEPGGDIPLRLYRGSGTLGTDALPVLVYFHGGGWVLGDLDSHDVICRRLANAAGCCVVAVDYRLAPEHPFPAAVVDAAAATQWVIEQAAALAIDPAKVAVGGDSAGGNLAAVMALMARDEALPPIGLQVLIYPAVEVTGTQPSYERVTEGFPLTAGAMRWFRDHYIPERVLDVDWRASPLRAADVSGTAAAFVLTVGHDPLCDEGIAYARRLEQEGVAVTLVHLSDQMHGFLGMGRVIRAAETALDLIATAMRGAWAT